MTRAHVVTAFVALAAVVWWALWLLDSAVAVLRALPH